MAMTQDKAIGATLITTGAVGAGVATGGGVGLLLTGTGVGVGTTVIVAAGAVMGSAVYGSYVGLKESDPLAFGALGGGMVVGAGVYGLIGGVGVAGKFGALGLGLGGMTAVGGVVGLGVYGLLRIVGSNHRESTFSVFSRMEDEILWQEAYTQALVELTCREEILLHQFKLLDVENDLQRLKAELERQNRRKARSAIALTSCAASDITPDSAPLLPSSIETGNGTHLATIAQFPGVWTWDDTLKHHASRVNAIAISPDGLTVATGSDDRTIVLWDLQTGNRLYTIGHTQPVLTLAFSSDGRSDGQILAGAGVDQIVTRWNVNTKTLLNSLLPPASPRSHAGAVHSIAFIPGGNHLISGSADKTVRVWTGDQRFGNSLKRTLIGHTDEVLTVAVSADGRTAVSGSADRTIHLWNLTAWEHPRVLTEHTGWVNAIAMSPDGTLIASGSSDSTIKLWDFRTGKLLLTLDAHTCSVDWVTFCPGTHPGSHLLASSSQDGTIRLWQLTVHDFLKAIPCSVLPGMGPIAFSPDGNMLVNGGSDGSLSRWRFRSTL